MSAEKEQRLSGAADGDTAEVVVALGAVDECRHVLALDAQRYGRCSLVGGRCHKKNLFEVKTTLRRVGVAERYRP